MLEETRDTRRARGWNRGQRSCRDHLRQRSTMTPILVTTPIPVQLLCIDDIEYRIVMKKVGIRASDERRRLVQDRNQGSIGVTVA